MRFIPAIDIIEGKPVRLYQGDYTKKTIVGESVLEIAKTFEKEGAKYLHIVDLDGAKGGKSYNYDLIMKVVNETNLKVDVGGGIRTIEQVKSYLDNGVDKITLGTAALKNEELLDESLKLYGDKIIVGVDCKDGYVCADGWTKTEDVNYIDFASTLNEKGVKYVIFTDISKDGTLDGPNYDMLKNLKSAFDGKIIASGGVKNIDHLLELKKLNVDGVIVGKALYSEEMSCKEVIEKLGE